MKFAGDPDTGIISPGANQLSLVTGGFARLTIDSSGVVTIPGNVNITGNIVVNGTTDFSDQLALILALS